MTHPYYIVQWSEGRLPCPPHLRCTSLRKEFERGSVGGKRLVERRVTDPEEAKRLWKRDRFNREVYVVQRPDAPRKRVRRPHTLTKETEQ